MKTIQTQQLENEMITQIQEKLSEELELIRKREIGSIIFDDLREIESIITTEIANKYFKIPLLTMEKEYPRISHFGIELVPNISFNYCVFKQTAKTSVVYIPTPTKITQLSTQFYDEFQKILNDIKNIYSELNVNLIIEFDSVESDFPHEDILRIKDIYNTLQCS